MMLTRKQPRLLAVALLREIASRSPLAATLDSDLPADGQEGCWVRGVCRRAGRHEVETEDPWYPDTAADRFGFGRPSDAEVHCLERAQQLWVACENSELEPVTARFSLTGAEASFPEINASSEEWAMFEGFAHYKMTYAWRSNVLNEFTDTDIALPMRDCNFDNGIDWARLREDLLYVLRLVTQHEDSVKVWTREPIFLSHACEQHLNGLHAVLGQDPQQSLWWSWAMSDAKNDCFLGMLSLRLFGHVCFHLLEVERGGFVSAGLYDLIRSTAVNLDGLFFRLQHGGDPAGSAFEVLALTSWPVVELLEALAVLFRQTFGPRMPSLCDHRDDAAAARELQAAFAARFSLPSPASTNGSPKEVDWRLLAAEPGQPWTRFEPCAFRQVCILLATAAELATDSELQSDVMRKLRKAEHWLRSWEAAAEPPHVPFLGDAAASTRQTQALRQQFVYDLLTSTWPVFPLLRRVRHELLLSKPTEAETRNLHGSAVTSPVHWETRLLEEQSGSLFVCYSEGCRQHRFTSAPSQPPAVVFVGGGENTPAFASFSLRGRQVARALRIHLRHPAHAWQHNCDTFCGFWRDGLPRAIESVYNLRVMVHVKSVCRCAVHLLPNIKHVLDVVDNSDWLKKVLNSANDTSELEPVDLHLDGVILESHSGAATLAAVPVFRQNRVPIFSIPQATSLAHASLQPRSVLQVEQPVRLVAIHTTHVDPVYKRVKQFLREQHPEVRFAHWRPGKIFGGQGGGLAGQMITSTQLRRVHAQLAEIDLTIVKQSGCLSDKEFCRRFKPGQRLLHAWAAGVPAVIVGGSSLTFKDYLSQAPSTRAGEEPYPSEVVVDGDGCEGFAWRTDSNGSRYKDMFCEGDSTALLQALDAAIRSPSLRVSMHRAGLQRALHWSPEWLAENYARAFVEVLSR